jgi:hypothetical protein
METAAHAPVLSSIASRFLKFQPLAYCQEIRSFMKKSDRWLPTKAVFRGGRWRASRDPKEVGVGSRAIADWMIAANEDAIRRYARGVLADIGCGNAMGSIAIGSPK